MRPMGYIILFSALGYGALLMAMIVFQRQLMYDPHRDIDAPAQYGLIDFKDLRIRTDDGLLLQLWRKDAAPGFPTIMYYHGNAGNLGTRTGIFAALARKGFGVVALSYRGYGKSEGRPSEKGLYTDGRAALRYLTGELGIPLSRIIIYGESLGTGVAVQMASEFAVAALVLQSPYTSVAARAAEIYYYIPVKWLIYDRFASIEKIARVKAPILIFHGEQDDVIPRSHADALLATAVSSRQGIFLPDVAHNDFDSELISSHVLDFAREHHVIGQ